MRSLRILHVLAERSWSGGEHQLAALIRHLEARGHRNAFICDPKGCFAEYAAVRGWPVDRLRMRNDFDLLAILGLRRLIRRRSPDIVHFACSRAHKLGGLAMAGIARPPARVVVRRMDYPLRPGPLRRWLYGRAVDRVVAVSSAVAREIRSLGVPAERIAVIHDGVDPESLERECRRADRVEVRAELGVPEGVPLGLTLASLHRRKGLDVLSAALCLVAGRLGRPLYWCIAGEGPLREELEACRKLVPKPVRLLLPGRRPAAPLLAAADLFVLPSRREGLGVALLEALSQGLPAVGSRIGGIPEVLEHEVCGLLASPGDARDLARAIRRLLERPAEARAFGEAGRRRVCERFSLDRMCRASEALYLELAARGM